MGKVIEKIKVINVFEPEREIELEAVVDTGATMLVLPQDVIDKLNLRKMREVKVRYANNKTEIKSIYGVVTVEMCGRAGEFNVLAEPEGAQPLVGQIILEQLDLIVDPSTRKVIPNPRSPEMPMVEVLMATPPNSGSLTLTQNPSLRSELRIPTSRCLKLRVMKRIDRRKW